MRYPVGLLVASFCTAGCSCADPSAASDASHDAHAWDTAWAYEDSNGDSNTDAGPCIPDLPLCTTDEDCIRWGVRVAPSGTMPITFCTPGGGYCTLGDTACVTHDHHTNCSCGSQSCQGGQICVADVPGGPTRCAQQCEGL